MTTILGQSGRRRCRHSIFLRRTYADRFTFTFEMRNCTWTLSRMIMLHVRIEGKHVYFSSTHNAITHTHTDSGDPALFLLTCLHVSYSLVFYLFLLSALVLPIAFDCEIIGRYIIYSILTENREIAYFIKNEKKNWYTYISEIVGRCRADEFDELMQT